MGKSSNIIDERREKRLASVIRIMFLCQQSGYMDYLKPCKVETGMELGKLDKKIASQGIFEGIRFDENQGLFQIIFTHGWNHLTFSFPSIILIILLISIFA
jgi:hypothetical protein